jgi:uncharacterized PurR-regulated membrane protein YhhQ (DUF165 family)
MAGLAARSADRLALGLLPSWSFVLAYLVAIVAANLAVAWFGQPALPYTAFLLIPFNLCARDVLHDRWEGRALAMKMAGLIGGGSLLTMALVWDARRVAVASFIAFGSAGLADTVGYWLMRRAPRLVRMNGSNLASSWVDSVVFPLVAFPAFSWWLVAAQAGSKFIGGLVWSIPLAPLLEGARKVGNEDNVHTKAPVLRGPSARRP